MGSCQDRGRACQGWLATQPTRRLPHPRPSWRPSMPAPLPPSGPSHCGLQHARLWSPVPTLNGSRVSGQLSRLAQSPPWGPICLALPTQTPQRWSQLTRLTCGVATFCPPGGTSRPPTLSSQLSLTTPRFLTGPPLSFQSSSQATLNPATLSPLSRPLEVKVDTWGLEVGADRLATLHVRPGAPAWRTLPRSPASQHTRQPGWSAQQQGQCEGSFSTPSSTGV